MGKPALADIALMADALRDIATIIGCPANVDPLTDLDGLVMMVRGLAERVVGVEARIADAVAADRMAIGAWVHDIAGSYGGLARGIEHGDHIDDDAPPLPSLRMVMLARDEAWRQVETLTAERDRRIEPVEHARAVLDAYNAGDGDGDYCATMRDLTMDRAGLESVRATLLAQVGPEVLAEVER